jgi:hypothetical protein
MTQFLRVTDPQANTSADGICNVLRQVEGIDAFPAEQGWTSVVSATDRSSAGPLVDELYNLLLDGGDIASSAIVRLLRTAAENQWCVEMGYSNDSDGLPTFTDINGALQTLLRQAAMQPPEIYLRFQP